MAFETFAQCGRDKSGGDLSGKLCVTAGCGGMGGKPLAVTMAKGTCLIADTNLACLQRRRRDNYLNR